MINCFASRYYANKEAQRLGLTNYVVVCKTEEGTKNYYIYTPIDSDEHLNAVKELINKRFGINEVRKHDRI